MTQTATEATDRSESRGPVVTIAQGAVVGVREDGHEAFMAIPYAAPPIGPLRWRPPRPAAGWDGVRDGTRRGPVSPQPAFPMGAGPIGLVIGKEDTRDQDEDALHLTVRRPAGARAGAGLPVMVWVHGGAFKFGHGGHDTYRGTRLLEHDVVLVTLNYRLGALGFLAHPELSAEDPHGSSGDYGALDVIAALRWVHDNIGAFGGDPDRVTLFGESAGGGLVGLIAGSPLAEGLIHRVISQSGVFFGPPQPMDSVEGGAGDLPLAEAERGGVEFLRRLGVGSIAEARRVPVDRLVEAAEPGPDRPPTFFRPNIDGWFLPEPTYRRLHAGGYDRLPVLVGNNSDEGAGFQPPGFTAERYRDSLAVWGDRADEVLEAYPAGSDAEAARSAEELMRDSTFAWPAWTWVRERAERGGPDAYLYEFDHRPPFPPGPFDRLGAIHAIELPYVFGTLDPTGVEWTDDDRAVSGIMSAYWANFAATGDPNGEGLPHWPAFSSPDEELMRFTATSAEAGPVSREDRLQTLDRAFLARHEAAPTTA